MFRKQVKNVDDYNNLTEEEKVDYLLIIDLKQIIKKEYAKPEQDQDIDLINECLEMLSEMTDTKVRHTGNEIKRNVEKAMERAGEIKARNGKHTKRVSRFRLTACIAVIMLLATQFIAMVFGYNPIMEIYDLLRSNESTGTLTEEGITYTYYGETKPYTSIDELVKQEELNVLYPIQRPGGVEIIKIHNHYPND